MYNHVLVFLNKNTIYCIFVVSFASLLSQPAKLLNFAKLNWLFLGQGMAVTVSCLRFHNLRALSGNSQYIIVVIMCEVNNRI